MVEAGAQPACLLLSNNPESDGFRFLIKKKIWRACVACANLILTCFSLHYHNAALFLETLAPICAVKAESSGKICLQCAAASLLNRLSCPHYGQTLG